MNRIRAVFSDMGRGYKDLALRAAFTAFALGALTLVSAAIALPLWALATFAKPAYSVFMAAIIVTWISIALFLNWRKRVRQGEKISLLVREAVHFVLKAVTIIAGIAAIPLVSGAIVSGKWHIGIPLALAYAFIAGLVFFARVKRPA